MDPQMKVNSSLLRPTAIAITLSIGALCASPAQAFSDDEARRAILDLRAKVQQNATRSQQATLQMADRIETLEQQVRTLRGQVERLQWEANAGKQSSQDQDNAKSKSLAADPKEQAAYDTPMEAFRGGKYKEAQAGFAAFIKNFPKSQLVPSAQFYEGSSRYANRDFKGSIHELQQLVETDPKSPRAPDALLIIAACQVELNDISGAKASLQKIVKNYPDSASAQTAKSRLKILK
jgi:tol-pal system protein YbgF